MIILPDLDFTPYIKTNDLSQLNKYDAGIYAFYNEQFELMYIGKAKALKQRIQIHLSNSESINTRYVKHNFIYYRYAILDDPVDREIYETYYINLWKPKLNQEKTFTYHTSFYDKKYNIMAEEKEKLNLNMKEIAYNALTNHIKLL